MPFFIALQFDLISALKSFACCSIFLFASLQSLPAYFNYWFCDSTDFSALPIFYSRIFVILATMPLFFSLIFNLISAYKISVSLYTFFFFAILQSLPLYYSDLLLYQYRCSKCCKISCHSCIYFLFHPFFHFCINFCLMFNLFLLNFI